jgi:hypothetical protein
VDYFRHAASFEPQPGSQWRTVWSEGCELSLGSCAIPLNGGQLRLLLWTLGEYDLVSVIDFPDDETATAVLLQVAAGGNVRTKTMKAFDAEQMSAIIRRTG